MALCISLLKDCRGPGCKAVTDERHIAQAGHPVRTQYQRAY